MSAPKTTAELLDGAREIGREAARNHEIIKRFESGLPQPAWTSEPPKEPGLYHTRFWFDDRWHYGGACRAFNFQGNIWYDLTGQTTKTLAAELPTNMQYYSQPIPEPPR